jgi:hypothetical protein
VVGGLSAMVVDDAGTDVTVVGTTAPTDSAPLATGVEVAMVVTRTPATIPPRTVPAKVSERFMLASSVSHITVEPQRRNNMATAPSNALGRR